MTRADIEALAKELADWADRDPDSLNYLNKKRLRRASAALTRLAEVAEAAQALTDANAEKLRHGRGSRQEIRLECAVRALDGEP